MNEELTPPPRLVEAGGLAGDCLRQALKEPTVERPLPPLAALRERRERRAQSRAAAFALSVLLVGSGLAGLLRQSDKAVSIRAEEVTVTPSRANVDAKSQPSTSAVALPVVPSTSTAASTSTSRPRTSLQPRTGTLEQRRPAATITPAVSAAEQTTPAVPAPEPAATPAVTTPEQAVTARACAELARSGDAESARGCYQKLGNGNGISAELGLFEQARIEGKVLRQPARALQTLELYRRRFPAGSLRAEVMLAQIDWLLATGDAARARALVEEALGSGLLRERTAELERLRARLTPSEAPK
jgi:hypothetical protein